MTPIVWPEFMISKFVSRAEIPWTIFRRFHRIYVVRTMSGYRLGLSGEIYGVYRRFCGIFMAFSSYSSCLRFIFSIFPIFRVILPWTYWKKIGLAAKTVWTFDMFGPYSLHLTPVAGNIFAFSLVGSILSLLWIVLMRLARICSKLLWFRVYSVQWPIFFRHLTKLASKYAVRSVEIHRDSAISIKLPRKFRYPG